MMGTATVLRANARDLPLANNSVDLVVTSPPYFALRSYQDAGEHYAGQIGDEPTPAEFVASLLEVTRECVRVLKPSGSLFVNLGDKYNAYNGGRGPGTIQDNEPRQSVPKGNGLDVKGVRPKSLIGIPWRYALACIDDLGLILRAEVIWSKPNGLPESVTDRVRRSHEQWFHFTLSPRYFSAVDEIRETYALGTTARYAAGYNAPCRASQLGQTANGVLRLDDNGPSATNPLGKLPGSVWTIPTEPLRVPDHLGVDHFAAFPTEFPRRIISGWSPAGVCTECGEGRRPTTTTTTTTTTLTGWNDRLTAVDGQPDGRVGFRKANSHLVTGYACGCSQGTHEESHYMPPTTPGVVLDPFGGTGTTAMVAKALGRHGISVDMSADYCRLGRWRTNDRNQLAKVLGMTKVEAPDLGQLDLFGEATA